MRESSRCLVIPLYNHGRTVRQVAERAIGHGYRLIVVDDGSTDKGPENLNGLDLTLIRHKKNFGKGAAILSGAREAARQRFSNMVVVDADGQFDPAEAGKLFAAAEGAEPCLVIGARRMEEAGAPGASLFGRKFSNFWVHLESGLTLPDTQSGLRLYPVAELLRLPLASRGFAFEVEVIARMAWAGIEVRSVPVAVSYPADRLSHFDKFADNFRLSLCHTRLVARALCPWPHRRLVPAQNLASAGKGFGVVWLNPLRFFKRLCREHTSAGQLAAAAWLGIFLGALPLLALHTVAIIYTSHRLHLNKLAAVGASQLCMPPLVPIICVEIGYFIRHGDFLVRADWDILVNQIHYRLLEWLIGSLIFGPVFGILIAALFYVLVRSLRRSAVFCESGDGIEEEA